MAEYPFFSTQMGPAAKRGFWRAFEWGGKGAQGANNTRWLTAAGTVNHLISGKLIQQLPNYQSYICVPSHHIFET